MDEVGGSKLGLSSSFFAVVMATLFSLATRYVLQDLAKTVRRFNYETRWRHVAPQCRRDGEKSERNRQANEEWSNIRQRKMVRIRKSLIKWLIRHLVKNDVVRKNILKCCFKATEFRISNLNQKYLTLNKPNKKKIYHGWWKH